MTTLRRDWEEWRYFNGNFQRKVSKPRLFLAFTHMKVRASLWDSWYWKLPTWRIKAYLYDRKQVRLGILHETPEYQADYKEALAMALFECGRDYDCREITKASVSQEFFDPPPQGKNCPRCGAPLRDFDGMVGEAMIMCTRKKGCNYGWCDNAGAIARVI